jgi:hypothetical protein
VLLQLVEATLKYITGSENLVVVTYLAAVMADFMPISTGSATVADFLMGLLTYFLTEAFGVKFSDWFDNDRFIADLIIQC